MIKNLMFVMCLLSSTTMLWAQSGKNPEARPANGGTSGASGGSATAGGGNTGQSSSSNCTVANDSHRPRTTPSGSTGTGAQTSTQENARGAH